MAVYRERIIRDKNNRVKFSSSWIVDHDTEVICVSMS